MFYFDLMEDECLTVDDEGCNISSLERARGEALAILIDALRSASAARRRRVAVYVRTENCEPPIYEIELLVKARGRAGPVHRVDPLPRF
jgi:hypothetical protein